MPDVATRDKGRRSRHLLVSTIVLALAVLALAGGARAQTELSGIDVSNWQHQIDWLAVAGSGNAFVFAKATEGTTFTDLTFPVNRSGSTVLGMRFGAYHFARPAGSSDAAVVAGAIAQADYFLSVAQPLRGELLPVLDLENTGGLNVARLSLWVQTYLAQIVARTGLKPIVYVSPSFWKSKLGDSPVVAAAGHQLWIAHWTQAALPILPGAAWGGLGWSFWQWSNCRHIPGVSGCVDGDRFNGTSFASVTVPAYPAGPPSRIELPTIVGSPQAGKPLAAVPGTWGGGKPSSFGYQWLRCDATGGACATITGATAESYTPVAADVGHALVARVRAATAAGSASASSLPTLAVASSGTPVGTAPKPRTPPAIAGTTQVGQTLAAVAGTWTGAPTSYSYQWRRCAPDGTACTAIEGAGGTMYTLTPGDLGAAISLVVTATGKGGSGSATSALTTAVTGAAVPVPTVGTAIARAGQAGAVTTAANVAVASWQPGALPDQAAVALTDVTSRLARAGTPVWLTFSAPAPLPWPIDVAYPAAPVDLVPGILPTKGVWQPVAELPSATLPAEQQAGAYRDGAGTLHVLTRTPARVALFAAGKWGDPRFTTGTKPHVALVNHFRTKVAADGSAVVYGRITLDTQAHLYVSLAAASGVKLVLPQQGTRIGWWLKGKPAKTLQALQLRPGALPIRLRVPAAQMRKAPRTLRIVAIDPYGRKSTRVVELT